MLDLRSRRAAILRPGVIGARELEPLVGPIASPNELGGEAARPSPGMMERHYAPRAKLVLFEHGDAERVFEEARREMTASGGRVGMLLRSLDADGVIGGGADAAGLYALRAAIVRGAPRARRNRMPRDLRRACA